MHKPTVKVNVDLSKPQGAYKPIYSWFGYDESNYTTMKYGKQLLRELHDLTPAPVYIRAHHLLTSGNGVPELKWSSSNVFSLDQNGKPVYDFTITDRTFDAYKNAGVRPMVELGFMPKDLASRFRESRSISFTIPSQPWEARSTIRPRTTRCGASWCADTPSIWFSATDASEVSTWYFEVWNEPDIIYWHGTPAEYFKLYDYAVAGVRAALPNATWAGRQPPGRRAKRAQRFLECVSEALPERQERGRWQTDSAELYLLPSQGPTEAC